MYNDIEKILRPWVNWILYCHTNLSRQHPLLVDLKNAYNSTTPELFQSAIQPLVLPSVKDWIPTQQLTFQTSVLWRCALLTNENVWVYKNMVVHTLMGCTRHADVSKAIRRGTHNWHFSSQKSVGVSPPPPHTQSFLVLFSSLR